MKKTILLSSVFLSSIANANMKPIDSYLINNCEKKITPIIKNEKFLPSEFETSNNLTISGEGLVAATGKKIKIFARLFDKECKPVSNAIIKLWQADSKGHLNYKSNNETLLNKSATNFIGTGATSSDTNGRFNFITIMPGKIDNLPAHINLMITHQDIEKFTTNIYFERDVSKIEEVNMLSAGQGEKIIAIKNLEMKDDIYLIDIILNQKIRNVSY